MTDLIGALTVVFKNGVREDDVQPYVDAIRLMQGVASVKTHVQDVDGFMARTQARVELQQKLWEVLRDG